MSNLIVGFFIILLLLISLLLFLVWRLWSSWQRTTQQQAVDEQTTMQWQQQWGTMLDQQLGGLSRLMHEGLARHAKDTGDHLATLREKLAKFEATQAQFIDLNQHMIELKNILGNRQARGAMGERVLADLVRQMLPASMYTFQTILSNDRRVDCLLHLPNPPGSMAVDAKFPLESYRLWIDNGAVVDDTAYRQFQQNVKKHIDDIAARYIITGETADFALMFVPAEAVYAEIHAHSAHKVVDYAFERRVLLVSPTTLMALLNTVRGIVQDVELQKQTVEVRRLVGLIREDVNRLEARTQKLRQHYDAIATDLNEIETSQRKISRGIDRVTQPNNP